MKKILALLLAGCMALALCACGTPAEPADETGSGGDANASANGDTVVIGVFEPLSGDNGAGGKQEVLGMQYANAETPTVDIGGKTYNVKLEVVDNESSNDKAVSAASNLISKNHCLFLVMCYKNHCDLIFLLDLTDFFPHFYPEFRIQITKWFIQKKHLRFCDQRSDQCYSLLLSSGNFPDRCPGIFFHIYDFQIFHTHFSGFFFSDATELQTIDHIFQNTHMWK